MPKSFSVEFPELERGEGVVDIAIRYDVKTGSYSILFEENGLPTTLPCHVLTGVLFNIATSTASNAYRG